MKKSLSILLSLLMVLTTISVALVFPAAADTTYTFNDDFESYAEGEEVLNGTAQRWEATNSSNYVAANANGWIHGAVGKNVTDEPAVKVAIKDTNKVLQVSRTYAFIGKLFDVEPNKLYTVSFKAKLDAELMRLGKWGIVNATGKTEIPVSGSAFTDAANWVYPQQTTYVTAADTNVNEYSFTFITTPNMTRVAFIFNGDENFTINEFYFDDFAVTSSNIVFDEDFSSYTTGVDVLTGSTMPTTSSAIPNNKGWLDANSKTNEFTVAEESGNKYMVCADWKNTSKLAAVKASTKYKLSFKVKTATNYVKNIGILDVTGKNIFPVTSSATDNSELTVISAKQSYNTTAGEWVTLTIPFTTGTNTSLIQFVYNDAGGNTSVCFDDFKLEEVLPPTAPTYSFNEDFESYSVGDKPIDGSVTDGTTWDTYASPNAKGWLNAYLDSVGKDAFTVAEEDGNKYLTTSMYKQFHKVATVKPNTEYTLNIRVRSTAETLADIALYDATTVLKSDADGYPMYPILYKSGNPVDDYTGLGLTAYFNKGSFPIAVNTWKDITINFTTGANTKTILFQFMDSRGNNNVTDFDDFELKETNYVLDDDFETYSNGDNPLTDSIQSGKNDNSVPGGNWWAYPNREGWYSAPTTGRESVADVSVATQDSNKVLSAATWKTFGKVVTVKPNTEYTLSFKNYSSSVYSFKYSILDVTGLKYVPFMNGGTLDTGVYTYILDSTQKLGTASTWETVEYTFKTGASTTKLAIGFTSDNRSGYLDDIKLTSEFKPEIKIITDGVEDERGGAAKAVLSKDTNKVVYSAVPYETTTFEGWYNGSTKVSADATYTDTNEYSDKNYTVLNAHFTTKDVNDKNLATDASFETLLTGTDYIANTSTDWGMPTDQTYAIPHSTIDTVNMVGVESATTQYKPTITNEKAYSGYNSLKLGDDTTQILNNRAVFKLVKVKPNTTYTVTYWYYQDAKNLFGADTGLPGSDTMFLGLNWSVLESRKNQDPRRNETGDELVIELDNSRAWFAADTSKIRYDGNQKYQQVLIADYSDNIGKNGVVGRWTKVTATVATDIYDCIAIPFRASTSESGVYAPVYIDHITVNEAEPFNSAYSFAVMPDIQHLTAYSIRDNDNYIKPIFDDIIDRAQNGNVKFVLGLGDITDYNGKNSFAGEWELAVEQFSRLKDVVPYSIVRGNHDGPYEYFSSFDYVDFKDSSEGSYMGMLNTYRKIEVNGIKYLILGLDFGAKPDVLRWANDIVSQNPDYNVIVHTHAYLYKNGEIIGEGNNTSPVRHEGGIGAIHPTETWDKFVSQHKNIVMVLSGHVDYDFGVVPNISEGVNGNKVLSLLIDGQYLDHESKAPDGYKGLVAYFNFAADGKSFEIEYYSTIKKVTIYRGVFELPVVSTPDLKQVKVKASGGNVEINTLRGTDFTVKAMAGNQVTLTAVPYFGNTFAGWYEGETPLGTDLQLTIDAKDTTITAKFVDINKLPDPGFDTLAVSVLCGENTTQNGWTTTAGGKIRVLDGLNFFTHQKERNGDAYKPYSDERVLGLNTVKSTGTYYTINVEKSKNYTLNLKWVLTLVDGYVSSEVPVDSVLKKVAIGDTTKTSVLDDGMLVSVENLRATANWENLTLNFNSGDNEELRVFFYYDVGGWANAANNPLPASDTLHIDDMVLFERQMPGDVVCDGVLDATDVDAIRKYHAGYSVNVNTAELDIDGNGILDDMDAIYLSKCIAGWPGFTLQ